MICEEIVKAFAEHPPKGQECMFISLGGLCGNDTIVIRSSEYDEEYPRPAKTDCPYELAHDGFRIGFDELEADGRFTLNIKRNGQLIATLSNLDVVQIHSVKKNE